MRRATATKSDGHGPRMERVDIHTVAQLARVSIATVSRTLNHVPTVNPKLAKRVRAAADELKYFPNFQARAMGSGRSRLFGLIVSEMTNPFFPELSQSFEEIALECGYEILVSSTSDDPQQISKCVRRMLERRVEGLAVMTFGAEALLMDQPALHEIPVVFVDVGPARSGVSLLKVDYNRGIRQGVQHLAALGHRKIAFVSGPATLHSANARLTAFARSIEECGISPVPSWNIPGDHTLEGGVAAAKQILDRKDRPTALMCSNDMTALGVLHKFYTEGLRVPDDFSLIGFDSIRMGEITAPPLTSIQMSRHALARAAINALRSRLENSGALSQTPEHKISTELVVRKSTGFPRGSTMHLLD